MQEETKLMDIVQLVGQDSLSEEQKVTLEIARIIREDFLQQDAFSDHDYNCPLVKSLGMLRAIIRLHDRAQRAIVETQDADDAGVDAFTWRSFRATHPEVLDMITQMKFQEPEQEEDKLRAHFQGVLHEIDDVFDNLYA